MGEKTEDKINHSELHSFLKVKDSNPGLYSLWSQFIFCFMPYFAEMTAPPIRSLKYNSARVSSFHDLTIPSRTQTPPISPCHHNWLFDMVSYTCSLLYHYITTQTTMSRSSKRTLYSCNFFFKQVRKAFLRSPFFSCNFLFIKVRKPFQESLSQDFFSYLLS